MSNIKKEAPQKFETELRADRWSCLRLYKADGSGASATIDIVKEIWLDISGEQPEPFKGKQYLTFHVFNYVDPSKMFRPGWSGCCVHDHKKPFTTLDDALAEAEKHAAMAIKSKKWVRFCDLDTARQTELGRLDRVCEELGMSVVVIS